MSKRRIYIIVADRNEVDVIRDNGFKVIRSDDSKPPYKYYHLENHDTEIVLAWAKIGIANAAAAIQGLIDRYEPKVIYNFGAVGSIDPKSLYKAYLISSASYGDVNTPWYPLGQIPGEQRDFPVFSRLKIRNAETGREENVPTAKIITNNAFTYRYEEALYMSQMLNANLFDMETAAYAQIALKNRVAFAAVKGVSDIIDVTKPKSNLEEVNKDIKVAATNAFNLLMQIAI